MVNDHTVRLESQQANLTEQRRKALAAADLERAGIGDGRHAFEIILSGGLTPEWRHEIEIRSAEDWSRLPGSPVAIEADATGRSVEFRVA